jgi:NAD(P)-dependent dehydrogenase (short-subunit alcohol dehydrogenase family)
MVATAVRAIAKIEQAQGHLDVVFANAGGGEIAPLCSITEAHFDKTFDTNVKGLLFTVQKALPLLRAFKGMFLRFGVAIVKMTYR